MKENKELKLKYQNSLLENENIKKGNLKEIENLKKENEDINSRLMKLLSEVEALKKEKQNLIEQNNILNKEINQNKKNNIKKIRNKELIKGYNKYPLNNSFCIFKSIENVTVLVYSTKEKNSLHFFDIFNETQIKEILKAHNSNISNLRHFIDNEKRDLILSICCDLNEIKIWDANKYEVLITISNIYKKGEIYSACLLNDNNQTYIITTNFHPQNAVPIYVYDFTGKKIKNIYKSNDRIKKIDTFYHEKKKINYIIVLNDNSIKSYDFNNNMFYNEYNDGEKGTFSDFLIVNNEEIIELIESIKIGFLKIWNFDTKELISKIKINYIGLSCICEWEKDLLFIGCEDKNIILVDKNGQIKKTLTGHNNQVCCMKKIIDPNNVPLLVSQSKGSDYIRLWV